ncbi:hypothetical protein FACS1894190_04720 [Spirochaetia bacterium]|nr:hypothetical protein FACS1894190_04720 [Spirochaetia bacterium]
MRPFELKKLYILIFLMLVVLSAVVLRPAQKRIFSEIEVVREKYLHELEILLGKSISYRSIGPSIFCTIDVHDFRMAKSEELIKNQAFFADFVPDVSAKRVRLAFSPRELLNFNAAGMIHSIKSIKVDYPLVEYNTEKDFSDYFVVKKVPKITAMDVLKMIAVDLPDNFTLKLKNGAARMNSSDVKFSFSGINARGRVRNDKILLKTRWNVEASFPKALKSSIKLATPAKVNLSFDGITGTLEAALALSKLKTDFLTLNTAKIYAKVSSDGVFIENTDKKNGYDISFAYNSLAKAIDTKVSFLNFQPSFLINLPAKQDFAGTLLKSRLSGNIRLTSGAGKKFAYSADLHGNLITGLASDSGTFAIAADGNEHIVNFRNLNIDLPRGSAVWSGTFNIDRLMPSGNLVLNDFTFTKTADRASSSGVRADIIVSSAAGSDRIFIFADTINFGDTELQALNIEILRSIGRFDVALSAIRFTNIESSGYADIANLQADVSFIMAGEKNGRKSDPELEVRLALEKFSLSDSIEIIRSVIEVPKTTGPTKVVVDEVIMTSEFFLTTDFKQTLFNIPHLVTALRHNSGLWATSAISGTDRRFDLTETHLVYPGGTVDVHGFADYSNINNVGFFADVFALGNTYFLEGALMDRNSLSITSDSGVSAALNLGSAGTFSGFLFVDDLHLPQKNKMYSLDVNSDFRYESADSWYVNFNKIMLSNYIEAYSSEPIMEISGRADQGAAVFDRLFFDNWRGPLSGSGGIKWDSFKGKRLTEVFMSGVIDLAGASGDEFIKLEINNDENSFLLWVHAENFQIGRFVNNEAGFKLTGEIGFFKQPDEVWSSAFDIGQLSGAFAGSTLHLSTQGTFDETELQMSETRIYYGQMQAEIPALFISLNRQNFQTAASINGSVFGSPVSAFMAIDAKFDNTISWFGLKSALDSISGNITFSNLQFNEYAPPDPFSFEFSRREQSISVTGGPENMIRLKVDDSGDFFAGLSYPSPVRFTVVGFLKNNIIDAQTSNLYVDLETLWQYIPVDVVNFAGGFINGNVRVTGQLNDPAFYGNAWVNSLRMRIPSFVDGEIGPTPARLEFDGNEIRLLPILAKVGKGKGLITGNFHISRWVPSNFEISIRAEQDTPIPIKMNIAGFLAKGTAAGNVLLEFSENALVVSGEVVCDEAEMSMDSGKDKQNPDGGNQEQSSGVIMTDITIISGRKVEFLWPNADFPILRATAASGDRINISSDSRSGRLSLIGDIDIKSGELFYFQRSFYIRSGSMHFNENEIQFDPRITARAETRDRSNNEAVTISMVIDNQPISNFTPRLESNPPLSQIEILSIMGEKFAGSTGENNVIERAFLSSTADVLAQFGVVRRFERTVRDFLHVDMFSMRTQAIQNAILLNVFNNSQSGQSGADPSSGARSSLSMDNTKIGNYFDNTTVFIGKYIGANMFLQGMVSLRYDPANVEWGGISVEPEISTEFKTPLFDLKWEVVTKNFTTKWVLNNNITLSKRWTLP